jgi:hypothetical protein
MNDPNSSDSSLKLFLSVVKDIEPYLDNIILVGGWLPFVYSKYLWKQHLDSRIVATQDIDFALKEEYFYKGKLLQDVFDESGRYANERIHTPEKFPVYYFVKAGKKANNMRIDFISHEYVDPSVIARMTGNKIEVAPINYTEILIDPQLTMIIDIREGDIATKVRVPVPAAYMLLKGITCVERNLRNSDYKFKKDMWSVYFILENTPQSEYQGLVEQFRWFKTDKKHREYFNLFKENVSKLFKSPQSKGPLGICELLRIPLGVVNKRAATIVMEFIKNI